jgi:hypothetical protein
MTAKPSPKSVDTFDALLRFLAGQTVQLMVSGIREPILGALSEVHDEYVQVGGWYVPVVHIVGVAATKPAQRNLANLPPA